jgi:hypothetical protein
MPLLYKLYWDHIDLAQTTKSYAKKILRNDKWHFILLFFLQFYNFVLFIVFFYKNTLLNKKNYIFTIKQEHKIINIYKI